MVAFGIILFCSVLLFSLYVLALKGRLNNTDATKIITGRYAHRGLHKKELIPENSLLAFKYAAENGFGIELDVHLMEDGELAVIHDSSLSRVTNQKGIIERMTAKQIKNIKLEGTSETIPLLKQVLKTVNGAVPLMIELKVSLGNSRELCEAVSRCMQNYKGAWCVASFDPRCVYWFKKNKPEVVRGQIIMNFLRNRGKFNGIVNLLLSAQALNFITKPDFISVYYKNRNDLATSICKNHWKMKCSCWTVRDIKTLDDCETQGFTPIFEQIEPKDIKKE